MTPISFVGRENDDTIGEFTDALVPVEVHSPPRRMMDLVRLTAMDVPPQSVIRSTSNRIPKRHSIAPGPVGQGLAARVPRDGQGAHQNRRGTLLEP